MTVESAQTVVAVIKSTEGASIGPALNLPVEITPAQLELLVNQLLQNVPPPYLV